VSAANLRLTLQPTFWHLQPSIVPDSSLLDVYKQLRDSTDNLVGLAGAADTDGAHAAGALLLLEHPPLGLRCFQRPSSRGGCSISLHCLRHP
jgi:hypothetical protein